MPSAAQLQHERRQLARAINTYVKDEKLPAFPHVTSANANAADQVFVNASRSAQKILGIAEAKIGHQNTAQLTKWLADPRERAALYKRDPQMKRNHDAAKKAWLEKYASGPFVFPIDGPITEMRTDRGQDMQGQPGKAVRAIGHSKITAVPPDSAVSSYGQIVGELFEPFRWGGEVWRWWYCFHLDNCAVRLHQVVPKGFVIAHLAARPPGAEDSAGWCEYGFALDAGGDIDQNVSADHNAPSGNAAHALFHSLDPKRISSVRPILAAKKPGHDPLGILANEPI